MKETSLLWLLTGCSRRRAEWAKRWRACWWAGTALVATLGLTEGEVSMRAAVFVVAPDGADANPGTLERPFATLQRAQRAVRQIAGREPATVELREGTYYLAEPLVFGGADSGTTAAPVVYRSYPGETAVISGGARLDSLRWVEHDGGIQRAAVPPGTVGDQLFVNGRRQPMARYPDFNPQERIFNGYAADAIDPERVRRWADPRGGFIHAMHRHLWGDYHYRITGRTADGVLEYEGGWQNNRQLGMHDTYRFVENIVEELDAPGEWFLDTPSCTLYFYPPRGLDPATAVFETVRWPHLVELRGDQRDPVQFLTFRDLVFRHAARTFMDNREPLLRSDWTIYRGAALVFEGTEDCALEDCVLDQVGGNAVLVNHYNRRLVIRGCHIADAGANGVAFIGDPKAVRSPLFEYGQRQSYAALDATPGPQSDNFPADCLVEDCLIYRSGRFEKQTAPVQIAMAQDITVRHCSIYDVPRAGINIGDGCWGGHVIEFCDVFDTVQETGDHGSFNSWGRDRFWGLTDLEWNDEAVWQAHRELPRWDTVKPIILRNNRWRCDHGWDIDLDDGSSHYVITGNLCLNGGIKNREGFYRVVENNVVVNNGFHPHVWYRYSQDVVRRNIFWTDHYLPAGGMPERPWGGSMDYNLVHRPGLEGARPAVKLAEQSGRDTHSILADALFVDPARGDFRVRDGSPARALGFISFPMDQFGVRKPELKRLARTPRLPQVAVANTEQGEPRASDAPRYLWQARVRDIVGRGDQSAYGLPRAGGVLVMEVPVGSTAALYGLQGGDVILGCSGRKVVTMEDLLALVERSGVGKVVLEVQRAQAPMSLEAGAGSDQD